MHLHYISCACFFLNSFFLFSFYVCISVSVVGAHGLDFACQKFESKCYLLFLLLLILLDLLWSTHQAWLRRNCTVRMCARLAFKFVWLNVNGIIRISKWILTRVSMICIVSQLLPRGRPVLIPPVFSPAIMYSNFSHSLSVFLSSTVSLSPPFSSSVSLTHSHTLI